MHREGVRLRRTARRLASLADVLFDCGFETEADAFYVEAGRNQFPVSELSFAVVDCSRPEEGLPLVNVGVWLNGALLTNVCFDEVAGSLAGETESFLRAVESATREEPWARCAYALDEPVQTYASHCQRGRCPPDEERDVAALEDVDLARHNALGPFKDTSFLVAGTSDADLVWWFRHEPGSAIHRARLPAGTVQQSLGAMVTVLRGISNAWSEARSEAPG